MAKKNRKSKKDKAIAGATTFKNKLRSLKRHVKNFPEDVQAAVALRNLEKAGKVTPRKAPLRPIWQDSTIYLASLARKAGYRGHVVLRWILRSDKNPINAYEGMRDPFAKVKKDTKKAETETA